MSSLTQARLVLAAIGVAIWGYAIRVDDRRMSWLGIAFLAATVALRFLQRPPTRPDED